MKLVIGMELLKDIRVSWIIINLELLNLSLKIIINIIIINVDAIKIIKKLENLNNSFDAILVI